MSNNDQYSIHPRGNPPSEADQTTTVRAEATLAIPENLMARDQQDFDAINAAYAAAENITLHVIGKPFEEHLVPIFTTLARDYLAFVISGKANMSTKATNEQYKLMLPRGQFIPLSNGSLGYIRNDLTVEEMDTIPICIRIKSGEIHFVEEFIDIQEQGLSGASPPRSPLQKKSFVRTLFRKQMLKKNLEEIIKTTKKKKKKKNGKGARRGKKKKVFVWYYPPKTQQKKKGFIKNIKKKKKKKKI